jgi:Magnesium chelatase, subunit ChlI C-terminal
VGWSCETLSGQVNVCSDKSNTAAKHALAHNFTRKLYRTRARGSAGATRNFPCASGFPQENRKVCDLASLFAASPTWADKRGCVQKASAQIRDRVIRTRQKQLERFASSREKNAQMSSRHIRATCPLSVDCERC